jgi:hypothetical protein
VERSLPCERDEASTEFVRFFALIFSFSTMASSINARRHEFAAKIAVAPLFPNLLCY